MNYKLTFNNRQTPFMTTLNEKVNAYFLENKLDKKGNSKMFTKSIILFTAHIAFYVLLVTFHVHPIINIIAGALLGFSSALIGFNVMHDGSHGSFSKNKTLNLLMAYSANLLGAEAHFWKTKHNVLHHTYTNVAGLDEDIEKHPLFRFCEHQERKPFHRYQYIYWAVLYPLNTISWLYIGDYKKYFTRKIIGEYKIPKMNLAEHIVFWISKILNIFLFIILPINTLGWLTWLLSFITMHIVLSVVMNVVFQLAHLVEGTSFAAMEDGNIQKEWAIHQVQTTADFATQNKLITWLVGGLNFQVEHHLYPKICHVHYPAINKFVRETCKQFDIAYIENETLWKAFCSHILYLKKLGMS